MLRLVPLFRRLARDRSGAQAVEFALVLPAFITLMVGGLSAGNLAFAVNALHYAVQDAARCAAVKTTVCTNATTTRAYAADRYSGPTVNAAFAYTATTCGHRVSVTGSYPIYIAAATLNVPISAAACHP
jgi:Flp pilus assembly protein TadG